MKKILSILLVVILTVGLIAGCGGSDSDKKETASKNEDLSGLINTADVTYVNNGEAVYTIIRPDAAEMEEAMRGALVFKQMKEVMGISCKQTTDASDGTDAFEILIGQTNRPESKQALDYLISKTGGRYNDYIVCTIGKKIVINAFNAEALTNATEYFVKNYLKAEGVNGGIDYAYAVQGDFKEITINGASIGKFRIIRPHFNFSYLPQTEAVKIVDYIYETTGYMLEIAHDEYNKTEGEYEIVIGNAQRQNVPAITNYDEYTIKIDGKRVFLNGGSPHATGIAVSEFAKMLKEGKITEANSVANASYETAMAGYDRATTYYPVYYDNFDGDEIDTTKWRLMYGKEFGRDGQNGKYSGMSNDPNFVYQQDGKFYIIGHENDEGYWGGTLTNSHTMAFQYGFVEHSVICPSGDGFWSLLWFSSTGDGSNLYYRAEIDLNECFGNGRITQANCHKWPTSAGTAIGLEHASLDGKTYGNDKRYTCPDDKTWSDDYHTFGFLWDETQMTFTADGDIWFSYDITKDIYDIDAFVNTYLYMKLSYSVGRLNNNLLVNDLTDEEWANSNKLICDWLYLYQFEDGKQKLLLK